MEPVKNPTLIFLLIVFAVGAMQACHKDPSAPDTGGGTSSGPLVLPGWVIDSVGPMPMPANNPLSTEGVALGRRLFHDERLSDDETMSCATCHLQSSSFSDPRPFSIGTDGSVGTRNAMAITGLGWSDDLFWDGRRHSLEGQAHDPVTNPIEMRNTWPQVVARLQADPDYPSLFAGVFGTSVIDSDLVVMAIAQFERTLVSFNSRFDEFYYGGDTNVFSDVEKRGFKIFREKGRCARCHTLGLFTDDELRNNGLDMQPVDSGLAHITGLATDYGKFKVPTLRNIAASAPYMHDSRFDELMDVILFYDTHIQLNSPNLDTILVTMAENPGHFTALDKTDLEAFLLTLTDSTFLTNPAFGPP